MVPIITVVLLSAFCPVPPMPLPLFFEIGVPVPPIPLPFLLINGEPVPPIPLPVNAAAPVPPIPLPVNAGVPVPPIPLPVRSQIPAKTRLGVKLRKSNKRKSLKYNCIVRLIFFPLIGSSFFISGFVEI